MHTLPQLLQRTQQFLSENDFPPAPAELYHPCRYMLSLGGKRIRPALLLMGYEVFGQRLEKALPAAAAVELFHNFTLIHDDIMDAAPLRRGQATVHSKYNLNTGILSGDAMLIHAYRLLAAVDDPKILTRLLRIFNRVAIEVCEGQQLDINFETRSDVSIAEYIRMIELKTAVLLGGALEMGATCADAPEADAENLYHFGRLAGIAFQIQDDFLDTFGDPATFGKQVGGDILQNKKTLLVLKTLEIAPERDRRELENWMRTEAPNPSEKVAAVRAIFERNDIPDFLKTEKMKFTEQAFERLVAVRAADERKVVLKKTISDLLEREQ